jgi:hypothetical protein
MRTLLMSLTVLAGATVASASVAHAAPEARFVAPVIDAPHLQTVQYYEDWRAREWRRHEEQERWRRHEERERWERWHRQRNW